MWRGVTPLAGITTALKGSGAKVAYAKGCERWSTDESGFAEAVAAAKAAEVAVVVVGTWSRDQYELWQGLNATTGGASLSPRFVCMMTSADEDHTEHVDVHSLNLVGAQAPLVRAVLEANPNTIVVFSSGKPITEPWISSAASALVQQFYPSEEGGNALADVLFGDHNPSGKLSVSFPHDIGTSPSYYDYPKGGRSIDAGTIYENGTLVFGHQYVLSSPKPLYPFGFGRSYTTFTLSDVAVDKINVTASDTVAVSVTVKNTGDRAGSEVVQVYVTDKVASVVTPNMELKGFKKLYLKAGEQKKVAVDIDVSGLGVWTVRNKYVVEKGEFVVKVGQDSSAEGIQGTASFWVA
jgi:beta-glucosidase